MLPAVLAAFAADLLLGSARIPPSEVLSLLLGGPGSNPGWAAIVLDLRLPKALTATLAGASLAVSGLLMQTLFRNPLAGPFILGISSAALVVLSMGAGTVGLLAGLGLIGDAAVTVASSLGAGAALALVLVAARRVSVLTLLILGMLLGYASSAVVTVLVHFADAERVQAYVLWTFGSFGGVTWNELPVLAPVLLVGLGLAWIAAKPLDALLLGEAHARSLGVAVAPARAVVLAATALLAGGVTAFCGPVAFLGVAVPHLVRGLLATARHRLLLPATALAGSLVALVADLLAQLPGSAAVLPLNAVTALIGAPVIAVVVLRRRGLESSFGA